jgi:hypothetical protein
VAKINTAQIRKIKADPPLPHAEEIVYKICKLFHWNTVPKTKILHEFSVLQDNSTEKLQKYKKIMNGFKCKQYPITFTFQAFVKGKTLPDKVTESTKVPNLSSYQKAYLLGCILGPFDARSDNVIFNRQTGELFEIDNEYIGREGYQSLGILNDFTSLKSEEISPEILNDVLNIELTQLAKIREKYKFRDENLIALWSQEPQPTRYDCNSKERDKCWSTIMENFKLLKVSILALRVKEGPITLEKLERGINTYYLNKMFDKKDVFQGSI